MEWCIPTGSSGNREQSEQASAEILQGPYSVEQDCNGGQLHSGEEISREFVVTCGDGAEVLEQIEESARPDCVHNRVRKSINGSAQVRS